MEYCYDDAVRLLTSKGKFHIELGLDRIRKVLEGLGNPQDKLKCIHVAGTNGKGSVCSILASILKASGKKVGLYTSPHIFKYTERIQINGEAISEENFSKYVFEVVGSADLLSVHLTEFEILTVVMFKYFAENQVDVVVLETGLGGRLDATNVISSNLCSIITHIDLDHTDRLGDTKDKIAYEKAGIIKAGCPVVTAEGYEVLKDRADELNSLFVMIAPFADVSDLSLKGTYQQENLSLALGAVELVFPEITAEQIREGVSSVKHPCRFEFDEEKMLLVDGAHNPNGALVLRESLDFYFPEKKKRFVFGCLNTKNYRKMIDILFEKGDEIYFYHFNNPNSVSVEELQKVCPYPSEKFEGLQNFEVSPEILTIVCGSFYMLQEVLQESK